MVRRVQPRKFGARRSKPHAEKINGPRAHTSQLSYCRTFNYPRRMNDVGLYVRESCELARPSMSSVASFEANDSVNTLCT
jgi:hypothetical protein